MKQLTLFFSGAFTVLLCLLFIYVISEAPIANAVKIILFIIGFALVLGGFVRFVGMD